MMLTAPGSGRFVSMVEHMIEPPRIVRRRWSQAERGRILAEAMAPGAVVSVIARRNGMSPQHLFTWLHEAGHRSFSSAGLSARSGEPRESLPSHEWSFDHFVV